MRNLFELRAPPIGSFTAELMQRFLALSFGAGLALLAVQPCAAVETFPVIHNEPIAIRILSGKNGQPLAHVRLLLVAGYDRRDLQLQMWHEEVLTDGRGIARLPDALANLPFLKIRVLKRRLCHPDSHAAAFSVERIRRDGISTPDRCGSVSGQDSPGLLTVFAK
jgi:hypothetical protein